MKQIATGATTNDRNRNNDVKSALAFITIANIRYNRNTTAIGAKTNPNAIPIPNPKPLFISILFVPHFARDLFLFVL